MRMQQVNIRQQKLAFEMLTNAYKMWMLSVPFLLTMHYNYSKHPTLDVLRVVSHLRA